MHRKDKAYLAILLCLVFYYTTIEAFGDTSGNNNTVRVSDIQAANQSDDNKINDYTDTMSLTPVGFNENDFTVYYNDRHLNYQQGSQPANTYLRKLLLFIYKVFRPVLENRATPILFYIAVISLTVLILLWFLSRSIEPVWQKEGPSSAILHTIDEANLIDTDFDLLLQQEIKARNYNNAVRLLFLQTLQQLARKGFIKWENEKTNYDYLNEIQEKMPGSSFNELLYIYEHCWYGNQLIDNTRYPHINAKFSEFQQRLNA